jgi:hypothetical protein
VFNFELGHIRVFFFPPPYIIDIKNIVYYYSFKKKYSLVVSILPVIIFYFISDYLNKWVRMIVIFVSFKQNEENRNSEKEFIQVSVNT